MLTVFIIGLVAIVILALFVLVMGFMVRVCADGFKHWVEIPLFIILALAFVYFTGYVITQ